MEDKKENKTFIMVLIGIIGVCLITIGLTYAYWILTKQQTGENVVNTACLNITFTGENDINLDKAYPMNNEQLDKFLSTATPYHFTIENTCDDLATATINLESLDAGEEKQLNDEYIDAILYETDYHTNLNSQKQLNESMYNDENKVIKESLHAYELYNFVLQKGETKSFNLLLYMDANTPMETANMNATWKGKITLSANYKEEPTANLNGLKVPVVETGDGLYAVSHDVSEISTDWNKTEYRYAGTNVNNYVSFNNEIWRVIGKVNVQTDNGIEQRIKIVRQGGINNQSYFGEYAWDYIGDDEHNEEYYSNWVESTIKDTLNGIYFNSEIGTCYPNEYHESKQCDFTGDDKIRGLDLTSREMVDKDVIWNLGSYEEYQNVLTSTFYEKERGNTPGALGYPVIWSKDNDQDFHNGIGLMYASDIGYTVGGDVRNKCLVKPMDDFESDNCSENIWLPSYTFWLLTIFDYDAAFYSTGYIDIDNVYVSREILPTLYLKSSVKITSNPHQEQEYGTIDNPFQLSL